MLKQYWKHGKPLEKVLLNEARRLHVLVTALTPLEGRIVLQLSKHAFEIAYHNPPCGCKVQDVFFWALVQL